MAPDQPSGRNKVSSDWGLAAFVLSTRMMNLLTRLLTITERE